MGSQTSRFSTEYFPALDYNTNLKDAYSFLTEKGFVFHEKEDDDQKSVKVDFPERWSLFKANKNGYRNDFYIIDPYLNIVVRFSEMDNDKYHDYSRSAHVYKENPTSDQFDDFTYPFPEFYIRNGKEFELDTMRSGYKLLKTIEKINRYYNLFLKNDGNSEKYMKEVISHYDDFIVQKGNFLNYKDYKEYQKVSNEIWFNETHPLFEPSEMIQFLRETFDKVQKIRTEIIEARLINQEQSENLLKYYRLLFRSFDLFKYHLNFTKAINNEIFSWKEDVYNLQKVNKFAQEFPDNFNDFLSVDDENRHKIVEEYKHLISQYYATVEVTYQHPLESVRNGHILNAQKKVDDFYSKHEDILKEYYIKLYK
jgi:hypothetical protein